MEIAWQGLSHGVGHYSRFVKLRFTARLCRKIGGFFFVKLIIVLTYVMVARNKKYRPASTKNLYDGGGAYEDCVNDCPLLILIVDIQQR